MIIDHPHRKKKLLKMLPFTTYSKIIKIDGEPVHL